MPMHTNMIAIETKEKVLRSPSGHTWQFHLYFSGGFYQSFYVHVHSQLSRASVGWKTLKLAIIKEVYPKKP